MRIDDYRMVKFQSGTKVHVLIVGDQPACGTTGTHPPRPVDTSAWHRIPFCRRCWDAAVADVNEHRRHQYRCDDIAELICEHLLRHDEYTRPPCVEALLDAWLQENAELAARRVDRGLVERIRT